MVIAEQGQIDKNVLIEELKALIIETCDVKDVNLAEIDPDDFLINGTGPLKLDSLDAIEIAVAVERNYGIAIRDVSSAKHTMRSLNALAQFISEQ